MKNELKRSANTAINSMLKVANLELVSRNRTFQNYIPFRQTLNGANAKGISVGDYIDDAYNVPGNTQATIDRMRELGALHAGVQRICEIGPGSGRYLDKTIQVCQPTSYEIYETAGDWKEWLVQQYKVTAQPTDGASLSSTPSESVDLVHAHRVLQGLPIFTTCGYFDEMIRVVRKSGMIVFDVLTEECMVEPYLGRWQSFTFHWIESMMAKQYAIDFFEQRGCKFVDSFLMPMSPGISEYLVFSR